MANKAISELPQALNVNNQDLFVLEQSGIAKKLTAETFITEQGIIDALAEALDGHGGIQSVALQSLSGRIRTYLITFTDGSATTFQVLDGTSISSIQKTSTAGLVDTYTVFLNDGSTGGFFQVRNGQDGSATWDQINGKAPVITDTVSGAIANFPDGADDIPVTSLVANIEPKQSGSGDPSPSNIRPISGWTGCNVTRAGKNLFDESQYQNLASTYEYSNDSYHCKAIHLAPNTTFKVSHRAGVANSSVIVLMNNVQKVNNGGFFDLRTASGSKTFTTDSTGCLYIGVLYSNDTAYNARLALCQIQIELGSTATDYEEYKGSSTATVSWSTEAGTVYGGTVDMATGLLTVNRAKATITNALPPIVSWYSHDESMSTWGFYYNYDSNWRSVIGLQPIGGLISDSFPTVSAAYGTDRLCCSLTLLNGVMQYVAFRIPKSFVATPADSSELYTLISAWVADNPIEICFNVAPQTYQLSPQQLKTLYGTNNVWADTGDVTVTYPADTKIYCDAQRCSKVVLTATIATADWTSLDPYTNSVSVNGLLATDTPIMDLIASSTYATAQAETADYAYIYKATCADNALMLYASQAPTVDLNVQLLCLR